MSEGSQTRRRGLVTGTAYGAFVLVMGAVETLAVRGQLDFGRFVLDLSAGWLVVVPVALEAGALTWAALALWQTLTRDSGTAARAVTRTGTVVAVGAAAAANWLGANAAGRPPAAAVYLAGASVMALAMWHVILHGVRHAELRAAGALEPPLPRFRMLRWLVAPRETARAYALAVREGMTSPAAAIAEVRGPAAAGSGAGGGSGEAEQPERVAAAEPAATTQQRNCAKPHCPAPHRRTAAGPRQASKSDRLRAVFTELGEVDVPRALEVLAGRGVQMDRSSAYRVARQVAAETDPAAGEAEGWSLPLGTVDEGELGVSA